MKDLLIDIIEQNSAKTFPFEHGIYSCLNLYKLLMLDLVLR